MAAQYHAAGPHDLVLAYTRDRLYRDRLAQVCVCVCLRPPWLLPISAWWLRLDVPVARCCVGGACRSLGRWLTTYGGTRPPFSRQR